MSQESWEPRMTFAGEAEGLPVVTKHAKVTTAATGNGVPGGKKELHLSRVSESEKQFGME